MYWILGLALGLANNVRHRIFGYTTPRPFSSDDVERAIAYDISIVDRWQERGGIDFDQSRVLEIGPGPDLGTGGVMIARGSRAYTAVDLFPLASQQPQGFWQAFARRVGPVDVSRIEYIQTDFPSLPDVAGSFDLILSNATLEHIGDVRDLMSRLHDLAAPGCRMCHHIDAKTHIRWLRDRDPLNIYRYSERLYRWLLDFPGAPNRMLADDYSRVAADAGWIDVDVVPGRTLTSAQPRLARCYRGRADTALLTFTLVGSAGVIDEA